MYTTLIDHNIYIYHIITDCGDDLKKIGVPSKVFNKNRNSNNNNNNKTRKQYYWTHRSLSQQLEMMSNALIKFASLKTHGQISKNQC